MKELIKSINNIKVGLQETALKKTGKNKFAKFNYFELGDFLPELNTLMKANDIIDVFEQDDESFKLTLIGVDGQITHRVRYTDTSEHSKQIKGIQWLGSEQTYFRRYLYLIAFGIVENDVIESLDNKPKPPQNKPKQQENEEENTAKINNLQQQLVAVSNEKTKKYENKKEMMKTAGITAKEFVSVFESGDIVALEELIEKIYKV